MLFIFLVSLYRFIVQAQEFQCIVRYVILILLVKPFFIFQDLLQPYHLTPAAILFSSIIILHNYRKNLSLHSLKTFFSNVSTFCYCSIIK